MRAAMPKFSAAASALAQLASGRIASASMSCVSRGRPRMDAATPPITVAGTCAASSHCTRSTSADSNDAGTRSRTQRLPQSCPTLTNVFYAVVAVCVGAEYLARRHQRLELLQLGLHRCVAQLHNLPLIYRCPSSEIGASICGSDRHAAIILAGLAWRVPRWRYKSLMACRRWRNFFQEGASGQECQARKGRCSPGLAEGQIQRAGPIGAGNETVVLVECLCGVALGIDDKRVGGNLLTRFQASLNGTAEQQSTKPFTLMIRQSNPVQS